MSGRGKALTLPAWMTNSDSRDAQTVQDQNEGAAVETQPSTAPQLPSGTIKPAALPPHVPASAAAGGSLPHGGLGMQQALLGHFPRPMIAAPQFSGGLAPQFGLPPPMNPNYTITPSMLGINHHISAQIAIPGRAGAPPPPPAKPSVISDPNNDASCWSEHTASMPGGSDGKGVNRKYWFNRVTKQSTYDKPLCLKTPEERAVPACSWKEYPDPSGSGKMYYSNGKDSTWTMPEEYKQWKEMMQAAEEKGKLRIKQKELDRSKTATASDGKSDAESKSRKAAQVVKEYATHEEAVSAFKQMMADCNVPASAKMKDVQLLCQDDPRWEALRSHGEKKQALAEYQTKRLKLDREQQKAKARRHRDAFLLMLAEHTDIDAATRWRDAVQLLQHDQRFKNVDDHREREDLYDEFISELAKKEQEEVRKRRQSALENFEQLLQKLCESGEINRKSVWSECRKQEWYAEALASAAMRELDDLSARNSFKSCVDKLAGEHREKERQQKKEYRKSLDQRQSSLRKMFQSLAQEGYITLQSKWKSLSKDERIHNSKEYLDIVDLVSNDGLRNKICLDEFEAVLDSLHNEQRAVRHLVKDVLSANGMRFTTDLTFDKMKEILLIAGQPENLPQIAEEGEETEGVQNNASNTAKSNYNKISQELKRKVQYFLHEKNADVINRLLQSVFEQLHEKAVKDHEEELKLQQKAELRFIKLLEEHFYLSEHTSISWDDAKTTIKHRSAYENLGKSDRLRLFQKHIDDLTRKLNEKTRSMMESISNANEQKCDCEKINDQDEAKTKKKRKREDGENGDASN